MNSIDTIGTSVTTARPSRGSAFERLTSIQARYVLAAWVLLTVCCLVVTLSRWQSGFAGAPSRGPGDIELYRAEVERIGRGESYYQAANAELRGRGYPTKSIFNWRTPLPIWLIGILPEPEFGKALLSGLALAALGLSFGVMERAGGLKQALIGGLALSGALMPCALGDLYVEPVLWSGVLMVLSLCGYAKQRPILGVVFGLLALFCRELVLPYCMLAAFWAGWRRNWREVALWAAGFVAYAVFLAWHASMVMSLAQTGDRAHSQSWIQFGGLPFVISTCQMNAYLLLLPQWVTALFMCLAILGFADWRSNWDLRVGATTCGFLLGLMVVGYDFNQYWGAMLAPMVCFGFARAIEAGYHLWQACRWRPLPVTLESPL